MKRMWNKIVVLVAVLALAASAAVTVPAQTAGQTFTTEQVLKKVRKELVTLPYYGVFDNLAYKIEGNTVTLYGQVVQPITRKEAEHRVERIRGVERVINNIEVLPLSPSDDEIRARTYRAVFRTGNLYRYARSANPSLHIIVNRGHVTLEGVVANNADRNLAYIAASGVPGVFSVTNNLRSERGGRY